LKWAVDELSSAPYVFVVLTLTCVIFVA